MFNKESYGTDRDRGQCWVWLLHERLDDEELAGHAVTARFVQPQDRDFSPSGAGYSPAARARENQVNKRRRLNGNGGAGY